jgi:hypothetical protein
MQSRRHPNSSLANVACWLEAHLVRCKDMSGVEAKADSRANVEFWSRLIRMPEGATMTTHVTETAAAPSELAVKHFQEMLAFETDCWDVHESLKIGQS